MPMPILFWGLMIALLVIGLVGWWPRTQGTYMIWAPTLYVVVIWILFFLVGCKLFGFIIQ